ncbi:MAG: DUF1365 family protein [Xanthomonadales bacterium]|nr:DUF1365 domain-containing protein [Xanthomonadales bacterium]NIX12873.1 DUF1365 family protein [Xanthomonadales bacterium]
MNSAIYEGRVRHRRRSPTGHEFVYRMFMVYLDLAELDTVFKGRWLWSASKAAPARFRRENHLGDPAVPLDRAVRDLVATQTGRRPAGPVRLLTQLSYFGYCFNPVSFYYCFDADDRQVEAIVAEVNNTPWGERHCYVLGEAMNEGHAGHKRYRPSKEMHVSPFMPMDVDYDWRFSRPSDRLFVHMENSQHSAKIFDATLDLNRTEIRAGSLARVLATYPLMTLKIIFGIHWQALKLFIKGVPVHDHPDKARLAREHAR